MPEGRTLDEEEKEGRKGQCRHGREDGVEEYGVRRGGYTQTERKDASSLNMYS